MYLIALRSGYIVEVHSLRASSPRLDKLCILNYVPSAFSLKKEQKERQRVQTMYPLLFSLRGT
jgi:hypothetical protein